MRHAAISCVLVLFCCLDSSVTADVQTPRDATASQPAAGRAIISGHVVLLQAGQPVPVRRARVTLDSDGRAPARMTDADATGTFRFEGLPAGTYRVSAEKGGFVARQSPLTGATVPPRPLVLADGQSAAITIEMQRGAAIEGRIVNGQGEPVMNLVVSAVRVGYGPYGRQPETVRDAQTDDLGRFRIHTLPAGVYRVRAAPDPLETAAGTQRIPNVQPTGLAPTFYPGTPSLSEAQVVTVAAGQEVTGLEFPVTSVPMAEIGGHVVVAAGGKPASFSVRVQRIGGPVGEVRGFLLPQGNQFDFPIVPPGEYRLMAAALPAPGAPVEYVVRRISVSGRDYPDVTLTTAPGSAVTGQVQVEDGASALPAGLRVTADPIGFELPPPRPSAAPATAAEGEGLVGPDGAFAFPSLAGPRLFRVASLPARWALVGVWLGGTDVTDAPVDCEPGDPPRALRLVVAPGGEVDGRVTTAGGQAAPGARVVLFADDSARWTVESRFVRSVRAEADGRFSIEGLRPGTYDLAAVGDLTDGAWNDPDVLKGLRAVATRVDVTGPAAISVDLTLRKAS